MEALESESACGTFTFRGEDYRVSVEVIPSSEDPEQELLLVDVEDKSTAEQWRGEFQPSYIKELTQKTGNFKQFHVFVDMLQSAVTKTSSSVALDLMTFSDLEQLRSRQGHKPRQPMSKPGSHVANKRYLILTYTVEFDRVHYPLQLPYIGKPDPVAQQATIRKLQSELAKLKRQLSKNHRHTEYSRLQTSYEQLLREKEELEEAFERFQLEVKHSQTGNATKEIRLLKTIIQNLETDLLKERSRYQRSSRKKTDENRSLLQELEDLRSSERNLRVRVKSLTNELAMLKRSRGLSGTGPPIRRQRSLSSDSEVGRYGGVPSARARSESAGRKPFTPSPSGARYPRFNPTAYVQDKKKKQKESEIRLGRVKTRQKPPQPRSRSNSLDRQPRSRVRRSLISDSSPDVASGAPRRYYGYQRKRTSSVGSRSGHSSRGSSLDRSSGSLIVVESTPRGIVATKTRRSKPKGNKSTAWASPVVSPKRYGKSSGTVKYSRKPQKHAKLDHSSHSADRSRDDEFARRSAEINEIDARLNKLKHFMKSSMEA